MLPLNIYNIVGNNVRKLREMKEWTQADLAMAMGMPKSHKSAISGLERGERGLSINMLTHLCEVLDCFPHELFLMEHEDGDKVMEQLNAEIAIMDREDIAMLCAHAVALNAKKGRKPE